MNDAPVYDLLRQDSIKTENHLMIFSDSSCQYYLDTVRSTLAYIIIYHGGPIHHGTHILGPVSQSSSESKYNVASTAGMALAHFRMLIHSFLKKDPDIVPEEAPLIILDGKPAICIAKNGKDTKRTRHILRRTHLVRNGEKCKMHKIDWCEVGLQLADIATNNVGEHDLTPRMKYMIVRLHN